MIFLKKYDCFQGLTVKDETHSELLIKMEKYVNLNQNLPMRS